MSWPELFGLLQAEAGYRPWEMDKVDEDDFADLAAFWKRSGRSPILVSDKTPREAQSSAKPPSEADIRALVALSNAAPTVN